MDRATSGSGARIGVTYYYYPAASCTSSTCQLGAGFVPSGGLAVTGGNRAAAMNVVAPAHRAATPLTAR